MEGLKRVSINGRPYPVFYGMYGLAQLMKQNNLKFAELQGKIAALTQIDDLTGEDLIFLYDFIHAGFVMGSRLEGNDFPHSVEQLSAYLPLSGDEINTVFTAFAESMPQMNGVDQKKAKAKQKQRK